MNDHRQRVVEAVERFQARAKPCEACGVAEASAGWRRGGRFGWFCSACRGAVVPRSRVPWEAKPLPPWRGPSSGDAA